MPEVLIDFITSLEGYGAAEGWPGWWGLEGPEYLAWLGDQSEADYAARATTLAQHATRCPRRCRGRAGNEGHRFQVHADHRQPHPVPLTPERRSRRPLPCRHLSRHYRRHRAGPNLRRL